MIKDKKDMWPERLVNFPSGQSSKLAVLTPKPGGLPEQEEKVLHPSVGLTLGPHPKNLRIPEENV